MQKQRPANHRIRTTIRGVAGASTYLRRLRHRAHRYRGRSHIIDAIFTARPSTVESNRKSKARTTFGASASTSGADEHPARLRGECARTCKPFSRQSRYTLLLVHGAPSSNRSAAQARRKPVPLGLVA